MNQIVIEIPEFQDVKFQAKDIDDAIRKLRELDKAQGDKILEIIKRYEGIAPSDATIDEEEWYRQ